MQNEMTRELFSDEEEEEEERGSEVEVTPLSTPLYSCCITSS